MCSPPRWPTALPAPNLRYSDSRRRRPFFLLPQLALPMYMMVVPVTHPALRTAGSAVGSFRPALGTKRLTDLSVTEVQSLLDELSDRSLRVAEQVRQVMRAAVNRAMREEVLFRNVVRLTELPTSQRKRITPWTAEQASAFLRATEGHPWHLGFMFALVYGMRQAITDHLSMMTDDGNRAAGGRRFSRPPFESRHDCRSGRVLAHLHAP
jgi:integrase